MAERKLVSGKVVVFVLVDSSSTGHPIFESILMFKPATRLDYYDVKDSNVRSALNEYRAYECLPEGCSIDLDVERIKEFIHNEPDPDLRSGWRKLLLLMAEYSVTEILISY